MTSKQDEEFKKKLSKKLKEARSRMNLTQQEVADKAGMDVTYYARIERGEINPKGDKLQKLSKVLQIELF